MAKAAKADADRLAALQAQIAQLQKDAVDQQTKADKSAADLAAAKAQVCSLAAQRAAETAGANRADAQVAAAPAEHPDGFVSIAFAEAKWHEREQGFAEQILALQAIVAGNVPEGEASAAPSEASDTQDLSSLDFEVDDEGWKQIGVEARKAIAAKHRKALAGKIARSVNK
eukprot:9378259-Karenia_brevis.AAC.1